MGALKQDFIVKPGSDPGQIRLAYLGLESAEVMSDGAMDLKTPLGGFRDERPVAYQVIDGKKVAVDVSYDLMEKGERYEYRFRTGPYDSSRDLVIDPVTIIYASFPVSNGPDLVQNGGQDAFVAKVNAAGTALSYAGFIGGAGSDDGFGIAVDDDGNAYVTGETKSTEATFPVVAGPDLTRNDDGTVFDAFVAKVNSAGTGLVYAGFIGGSGDDSGNDIAIDEDGNAYVTGYAASTESTFPVSGDLDLTQSGDDDAFVAKVNAAGTALAYAGYIGGNSSDIGNEIAIDADGNVYVTGYTASSESSFPVSGGPDLTQNGTDNAFAAKIGIVAVCGDGVVEGSEGCDDGNDDDTDSCLATCVSATCGDGEVQSDVEACDNGGSNSDTAADACRTTCVAAACGDGVIDTGETCDDGNTTADDGCSATCETEEEASAPGDDTTDNDSGSSGGGCSLMAK